MERKVLRKQAKYVCMIEKNENISVSEDDSCNIIVGNAGLVIGIQRHELVEEFSQYGIVKDVIMVPHQPYSFIVYSSVQHAKNAMEKAQGKSPKYIPSISTALYLLYSSSVPELKLPEFGQMPPGLKLVHDFVSEREESELLAAVNWTEATNGDVNNMKHRKVKHYGFEFLYTINNVDRNKPLNDQPIPESCDKIIEKAIMLGFIDSRPDQLTVNQYLPGQGIPPHIDTHSAFHDEILSLSLGSNVVMDFENMDTNAKIQIVLPSRSLLVMTGESRYLWTHGIVPRKTDVIPSDDNNSVTLSHRKMRTSFTFRKIRQSPCNCVFKSQCDSQKNMIDKSVVPEDVKDVQQLEKIHVHQVYEEIAQHFSETRHKPWPHVKEFVSSLISGSVLVDVGCGNGKYFGLNESIVEIGTDRSGELTNICHRRGFECFTAEMLTLPLRDSVADACICIAVIHHLASEERRLKSVAEICRILRNGGKALLYVWAMEQCRNNEDSNYLKKSRHNCFEERSGRYESGSDLPVHVNRTEFKQQDMLVPWHLKECQKVYQRYYHLFTEGELEKLCLKIENVSIVRSYYDKGNWCVIIEKKLCHD